MLAGEEAVNPYQILGVPPTASKEAIRKAFRRRSMETHPDRGGVREDFEAVKLAYRILSDKERRARFDATGVAEDDQVDNSEAAAVGILRNCFGAVIQELMKHDRSPAQEDVVAHMVTVLKNWRQLLLDQKKEQAKARKFLTESLGRFTTEGENYLEMAIRADLAGLEGGERAVEAELAALKDAGVLLKRFVFRHEEDVQAGQIVRVVYFPMGSASTSTSAGS